MSSVIAANLMGNKIADFGLFQTGVGIMIFPFSYIILDIIQEVEGKATARKILLATLAALVLVTIITFIGTQYQARQEISSKMVNTIKSLL